MNKLFKDLGLALRREVIKNTAKDIAGEIQKSARKTAKKVSEEVKDESNREKAREVISGIENGAKGLWQKAVSFGQVDMPLPDETDDREDKPLPEVVPVDSAQARKLRERLEQELDGD